MVEIPSVSEPQWRHFCTSVRGASHIENAVPCQDASALSVLGDTVILALSDGAGSASQAERGANLVVRFWLEHFRGLLEGQPDAAALLAACTQTDIELLLKRIHDAVGAEAEALEVEAGEFSATLLGAVVTPTQALVAQVGDGGWVALMNGVWGCLTWPTGGEFVGQTTFATSDAAASALQFVRLAKAPEALVGFTDGLERLLLDFQTRLPATGFFLPALRSFKQNPVQFPFQLKEYLASDEVCARTDDDKSLGIVLNPNGVFGV
jgi:hypothetical protein